MKKIVSLVLVAFSLAAIAGCTSSSQAQQANFHTSEDYYNYIQPTFDDYLDVTGDWLEENRAFISEDHETELAMNMPFQKGDPNSDKAILLVHGLGDSPFSFWDVSDSLVKQGFYVQVLLLPGHGSNPQHMASVQYSDWQLMVDHYAELLKTTHEEVWLGGFSTGGNLVSIHALDYKDVDGLILFSPGFQTVTPMLEKLTPFVALFTDGWTAPEDNFAKYSSAPINSALAYSESAVVFRDKIKDTKLNIPTLMVASEADSIIDAEALSHYFQDKFTHPQSQMIWYGSEDKVKGIDHTLVYSMQRDDLKISTASHMSALFSPNNSYYGQNAQKLICENSLRKANTEACKQGEPVWFSAWGYTEKDKIYARLTWNPYFEELESVMGTMTQ